MSSIDGSYDGEITITKSRWRADVVIKDQYGAQQHHFIFDASINSGDSLWAGTSDEWEEEVDW